LSLGKNKREPGQPRDYFDVWKVRGKEEESIDEKITRIVPLPPHKKNVAGEENRRQETAGTGTQKVEKNAEKERGRKSRKKESDARSNHLRKERRLRSFQDHRTKTRFVEWLELESREEPKETFQKLPAEKTHFICQERGAKDSTKEGSNSKKLTLLPTNLERRTGER